jgi:hypothetical protein
VHKGVAQQTKHRLPGGKIVVVSELETVGALVQSIEDKHCFDIELVVGRAVTSTEVVSPEKNDRSGPLVQIGHVHFLL